MKFQPRLTIIAALLGAAVAGCASWPSPEANQQLERARAAYRNAAADPAVQQHAQAELQSASGALHDAERMAQEGKPTELVQHNAYLAEQRAQTAMRTAEIRRSEARIAAAGEQRRQIQLEARERETIAARQREAAAREQARKAEEGRREADALADLRAKETSRGWVLTLKNELLFDTGGSELKPGAERALDNLVQFLEKHRDRSIAIEGFTDSTGSKEQNQLLSEKRAWAVKAALVKRGIASNRIDARGYGPAFPVASNDNAAGRQLNRRVEIVIDPS